jgi:predicted regulator of Ras-like GTPase activity (Roadblock/LC7/MglB family)
MGVTIFHQEQLDRIGDVLQRDLNNPDIHFVLLIDVSGHIIARCDHNNKGYDAYALAALSAGCFAAVKAMAAIVGEEEFPLMYHKGKKENIHFSRVGDNFLLITIFGNEMSLGLLRLNVTEVVDKIKSVLALKF